MLLTCNFYEREVMVVAVRSLSGFVEVGKDGNWVCSKDGKHSETHSDPVSFCNFFFAVLCWFCGQDLYFMSGLVIY